MNMMTTAVRAILEKMYKGTCDVIVHTKTTDPVTKKTSFIDEIVLTGEPCRLSYASSPTTGEDNVASITQEITLFLSPDVRIQNGSKIIVTQNGETRVFKNTSEPKLYESHQEISLEMFDKWS